jgi:hypothetical protein
MGKVKADAHNRIYGTEYYVCEIGRRRSGARQIDISEKNHTMIDPVGRVKKIPKMCREAMRRERGGQR